MFNLANKTALVTGAASGIGAAVAETFAAVGASVWIADRDTTGGQAVAMKIGGRFLALDVSSDTACADAAMNVGPLDVLVNVAGIGHVGTLMNTASTDLDRLYQVNVRGVFNCCKAFVPAMLERKEGINMASIAGIVAVRERLAYTMTKFAVVGLTRRWHWITRIPACVLTASVHVAWRRHLYQRASRNIPTRALPTMKCRPLSLQAAWHDRKRSPPPPFTWRRTRARWSPAARSS
jgi:NAD(P)-dependent dehydrogenase (short-subunit alcohol dehydrogenase family)